MLQVESLQKAFGDFRAVSNANLSVKKGELVAVIGPNGAGKTTLFNLISGQLKPDGGRILFYGENISRLPPYQICRRGIARSFQIANIYPRLTVFRNVQVSVFSQQKISEKLFYPAARLAVQETTTILEQVGLLDKAQEIAGSLSHGDKRVLEIAIALGNNPELLILDEPTAGMSPEETRTTLDLIKQLTEARGLTILFCEHDMKVVFDVAKSIMVMQSGQTLVQDTPERVRKNRQVLGGQGRSGGLPSREKRRRQNNNIEKHYGPQSAENRTYYF
ncbi:MAG: ABC transporter ATP-binding protein [Deltaproteobacteria bacterium]